MNESVISIAGREHGQAAMPHSVCGVNTPLTVTHQNGVMLVPVRKFRSG